MTDQKQRTEKEINQIADHAEVTKALNSLHFVRWDRFVDVELDYTITAYGWIDREDEKKDFVVLTYYKLEHPFYIGFNFVTSSKKFSKDIAAILGIGNGEEEHVVCQRVEDVFTECKNSIKLLS